MKNISIYKVFVISLTFILVAGCTKTGSEALMPKRCGEKDSKTIVCLPSVRDLASDPRGYDGKEIIISGYLVIDRGALSLYSDELSYSHYLFQDNVVLLRAPEDKQKEIFEKFSYSYIRVKGLFHKSKYLDFRQYEIGELEVGSTIYKLPDRTEPSNRESWGDVKIDVQDLSGQVSK